MKPVRGFRQWARGIDGGISTVRDKKFPHYFSYNGVIRERHKFYLRVMLRGGSKMGHIGSAFHWSATNQGSTYWCNHLDTPLTQEEALYFEYLLTLGE